MQVCVVWGKWCGCYIYSAGVCDLGYVVWVLHWSEFTVQVCVVWGKWCGCYIYSAGVCDLGYVVWVLHWSEFTVQVCVVWSAWYGCYIGQFNVRCVWFYVSGMGATLVCWLILRKAAVFGYVSAVWVVDIYINIYVCVCV